MSSSAVSNYSLWKASRKLTRPRQIIPPIRCSQGGWARSPIEKANLFANYLSNIFKPHSSNTAPEITEYLHSLFQMFPPIKPFTSLEVIELIHRLNSRKAPGHGQISNKAIKELAVKGIALISSIFNAILRLEYYPKIWITWMYLRSMSPHINVYIILNTKYKNHYLFCTVSSFQIQINKLIPPAFARNWDAQRYTECLKRKMSNLKYFNYEIISSY